MSITEPFSGMEMEISGRRAVVRSLTESRCWLLFEGDLVASGFTLTRIRKLLTEGTAIPLPKKRDFGKGGKKERPTPDLPPRRKTTMDKNL